MNQNIETEGGQPESENQTVNEPVQPERKLTSKIMKLKAYKSPLKKGVQFKFGGIIFEVYDFKERGARSFVRMIGAPVIVDEQTGEVV